MKHLKTLLPHAIALFASLVFIVALPFKFTNDPKTQEIFSRLDSWTTSFGVSGIFNQTGIFSQYVIGGAELIAALLLVIGIIPRFRRIQGIGAALAFMLMAGAVFFHLFTPLSIDPNNDGGGLFISAVVILVTSGYLVYIRLKK